jgi:N-acetylmuramoyl-L-alanine amidase
LRHLGSGARRRDNGPAGRSPGACPRSAFHVILDVGHGVASPGADSARGVTEYSFNLRLADVIKQALVDAGFNNTVRMITATRP